MILPEVDICQHKTVIGTWTKLPDRQTLQDLVTIKFYLAPPRLPSPQHIKRDQVDSGKTLLACCILAEQIILSRAARLSTVEHTPGKKGLLFSFFSINNRETYFSAP